MLILPTHPSNNPPSTLPKTQSINKPYPVFAFLPIQKKFSQFILNFFAPLNDLAPPSSDNFSYSPTNPFPPPTSHMTSTLFWKERNRLLDY